MSTRVSRLSESSDSSGAETEIPPRKIPRPEPPKAVPVKTKAKSSLPKQEMLEEKYSKRYTNEDPNYAEILTSEPLPPPVIPEYGGRRGGGWGRRGGNWDGRRQNN